MASLGRWVAALGATLAVFLFAGAGTAYARGGLQQCLDQAIDHNGEPPTCTKVKGTWVASWPDDGGPGGSGIPGAFVLLFVVGAAIAIALVAWKVSTARKLATQAGMDPGLATKMTLLTDDGLDATYLAASLRRPATPSAEPQPQSIPSPSSTSAAKRLAELKGLFDSGLVTQAEYDERRKAIIDAV